MAFEKHGDASVTAVIGEAVKKPCPDCGKLIKEGDTCSCLTENGEDE